MYGMINEAVRKLVVTRHGEPTWIRICKEAGVNETDFGSLQEYPDEITYKLVGAASKVLGLPAGTVLEIFGEYWTDFAQETSFARLMKFGGHTLQEFISNLDQMHAKIKLSLPNLEPPSFRVTDHDATGFRLHYRSKREGLAPLVVGMLKGMARMHKTPIEVRVDRARADGHDHDEFVVRYVVAAAAAAE